MNPMLLMDAEIQLLDEQTILSQAPEWSESEALTRKGNRTKPETVNAFLEEDRASWKQRILDDAGLNPFSCKIALVTWWQNGRIEQWYHNDGDVMQAVDPVSGVFFDEEFLLKAIVMKLSAQIISNKHIGNWNLLGYDLPMLVRRCWVNGVKVPRNLYDPLGRYPYSDRCIDFMQAWKAGKRDEKHTSLSNALRSMGLPEKEGSGKDFPKLWVSDRPKAMQYAHDEMVKLALLAGRMGVMEQPTQFPPRSISEFVRTEAEDMIPA